VSKRSNVIEVNGKRYDALTGRLLTGPASIPRTGIVMDGVAKPKSATRNTTSAHTAHKVHQTTERSKTLMRSAVRKPVPAQKPGTLSGVQKSRPQLTPKPTLQQPNLHRAKRATEIPKSNLISKFVKYLMPLLLNLIYCRFRQLPKLRSRPLTSYFSLFTIPSTPFKTPWNMPLVTRSQSIKKPDHITKSHER
jgi:hypothetical protein